MNKMTNNVLLGGESEVHLSPDLPIALANHLPKAKKKCKNLKKT